MASHVPLNPAVDQPIADELATIVAGNFSYIIRLFDITEPCYLPTEADCLQNDANIVGVIFNSPTDQVSV